jgi:hypothetical protein
MNNVPIDPELLASPLYVPVTVPVARVVLVKQAWLLLIGTVWLRPFGPVKVTVPVAVVVVVVARRRFDRTVTVAQTVMDSPVTTDELGVANKFVSVSDGSANAGVAPTDSTTMLNASAIAAPTAGFRAR